jgi:hypothetical protein
VALWVDFLIFLLIGGIAVDFGWIFPLPEIRELFVLIGAFLGIELTLLFPLCATLGMRLTGLEFVSSSHRPIWTDPNPTRWRIIERRVASLNRRNLWIGALTLATTFATQYTLDHHPGSARGHSLSLSTQNLNTTALSSMRGSDRWIAVPFFYAMGSWPREFGSNPVLAQIPYRPGLPREFLTSVIARWRTPDIKLTLEGPRTPELTSVPGEIRDCMLKSAMECLGLRRATVTRHVREMRALGRVSEWTFGWFDTAEPDGMTPLREDRAQGVYVFARYGTERIQERFIIINTHGRHQTLILDRPDSAEGETARALLNASLTSIQMLSDLGSARAYTDSLLETINLKEIEAIADSAHRLNRLAEVQAILASKLTVDPRALETYTHMAGTALLVLRHAKTLAGTPGATAYTTHAATAGPLIDTLLRYSRDVAQELGTPNSDWVKRLEEIQAEAKRITKEL